MRDFFKVFDVAWPVKHFFSIVRDIDYYDTHWKEIAATHRDALKIFRDAGLVGLANLAVGVFGTVFAMFITIELRSAWLIALVAVWCWLCGSVAVPIIETRTTSRLSYLICTFFLQVIGGLCIVIILKGLLYGVAFVGG